MYKLMLGDCLERMKELENNYIDAIVTDPPYGLSFMGKNWDHGIPGIPFWQEALRVLKPGGHLLAFGGTRTYHRLACTIEDAGFEIRDCIMWVYGSGFPKSLDVGKAIDKAAGADREVVGSYEVTRDMSGGSWADLHGKPNNAKQHNITAPATEAAKQWDGWGTALKPAVEPVVLARKPLIGTVAENVLKHGVGGLNIDASRIGYSKNNPPIPQLAQGKTKLKNCNKTMYDGDCLNKSKTEAMIGGSLKGRFPANLIHDGSEEVLALFPETDGGKMRVAKRERNKGWCNSSPGEGVDAIDNYGDTGSTARFFYCAKCSKKDRDKDNTHPTVKPTDLMRYLCKLITPPNGIILDPFMGSGSTGKAAMIEGFKFIGIEKEKEYFEIAKARIKKVKRRLMLL